MEPPTPAELVEYLQLYYMPHNCGIAWIDQQFLNGSYVNVHFGPGTTKKVGTIKFDFDADAILLTIPGGVPGEEKYYYFPEIGEGSARPALN